MPLLFPRARYGNVVGSSLDCEIHNWTAQMILPLSCFTHACLPYVVCIVNFPSPSLSLSLSFFLSFFLPSLLLSFLPSSLPSLTHTTVVAPSIQELPPKNRTVSIDDTLTIPVRVAGVPTPTISWRNSSTDLVNSSRVVISDTGSLTVTGVKSYDRGNYSLNLTNVGGYLIRYFSVFVPC